MIKVAWMNLQKSPQDTGPSQSIRSPNLSHTNPRRGFNRNLDPKHLLLKVDSDISINCIITFSSNFYKIDCRTMTDNSSALQLDSTR